MIVPYCLLADHYLEPLYVDTDTQHSLDTEKFPGLTDTDHTYYPALVIARTDHSTGQDSPGQSLYEHQHEQPYGGLESDTSIISLPLLPTTDFSLQTYVNYSTDSEGSGASTSRYHLCAPMEPFADIPIEQFPSGVGRHVDGIASTACCHNSTTRPQFADLPNIANLISDYRRCAASQYAALAQELEYNNSPETFANCTDLGYTIYGTNEYGLRSPRDTCAINVETQPLAYPNYAEKYQQIAAQKQSVSERYTGTDKMSDLCGRGKFTNSYHDYGAAVLCNGESAYRCASLGSSVANSATLTHSNLPVVTSNLVTISRFCAEDAVGRGYREGQATPDQITSSPKGHMIDDMIDQIRIDRRIDRRIDHMVLTLDGFADLASPAGLRHPASEAVGSIGHNTTPPAGCWCCNQHIDHKYPDNVSAVPLSYTQRVQNCDSVPTLSPKRSPEGRSPERGPQSWRSLREKGPRMYKRKRTSEEWSRKYYLQDHAAGKVRKLYSSTGLNVTL